MRYIIVEYSNGYCGCDRQEYLAFQDYTTDEEIDQYCVEELNYYAETYKLVARNCDDHWTEEDDKNYYSGCSFDWFDINPKDNLEFNEDDWTKVS